MKRVTLEGACLGLAIITLVTLLAQPSLALQDAEATMSFSSAAVRTGPALSWRDGLLALNTVRLDGASRPRVLSYAAYIISVKTRLWLWQFVTPHPSLSPVWILTMGFAPWLLYRGLVRVGGSRAAAIGVSLYLCSTGFLSGAVLFFHPGKPLTHVLLILVWYLCVRIGEQRPPHEAHVRAIAGRRWTVILCLLAIAPFIDEAAVFVAVVPVAWLWPCFRPAGRIAALKNWCLLGLPLACAALVIFVAAPLVSERVLGYRFDTAHFVRSMAELRRLDVAHFLWQFGNLFGAHLLPWAWNHTRVPVTDGMTIWWSSWMALLGIGVVVRHALTVPQFAVPLRAVLCLLVAFVLFHTVVFVVHDFDLVASGFYYGSAFSVLFALLGGVLYAAITTGRMRGGARALSFAVVIAICGVGVSNTLGMSASWRSHSAAKLMIYAALEWPDVTERLAHWAPLHAQAIVFFSASDLKPEDASRPYLPASPTLSRTEIRQILYRWRNGDIDILAGQPVTDGNAWLVRELELARAIRTSGSRTPVFR